ncbi:MAG: aminodeoxychorismate synthase component I, partial [Acinetobacter sp.]|nr:aminodeoxychorismate synthase component I [Acinetobacter sp.]
MNELTQLVYLQNVDAPVIAFLPERYQVFQKKQHFFFQRTQDFCYIRDDKEIDISSNIQPSTEQKEASFSGGLIGFVSYDYAAQQHVPVQIKS